MGTLEPGGQVLVYANRINVSDVEVIGTFVTERIARSVRAERGSDERQVARSVKAALLHVVGILQHALPLSREEDGDADSRKFLHLQIMTAWNTLWALASPWQWHENYDHERWRHVKYWDAEQEAEQQSLLSPPSG
ncbi:hypothetical protein [Streptomyces sp. ME18-1-4]|jgi:hypothetical protein|uniref:hypothetical protein n=1 Tax=Streptomyces sp. ME18-1-4 TaxID=3028685 RepID=UPI0029B86CEE|nr:hypothetical protein [Streptomyces sp. ME18-1-4]MDX3244778.1 hypothetical protein [Streptomyces sp. ME18-1-4]